MSDVTLPDATHDDAIVCPWCGHRYSASWEYGVDYGAGYVMDCESCGKAFEWECETIIEYRAYPVGGGA